MEMAVIMKRGKARLDESEGATAVRTDRLSCGVQRFRSQDAKYPEAGQNRWTSGGRYISFVRPMQAMVHPTRVDEVAGAGGTDAQAGGAGQATSLVAFLGCELNQQRGLSGDREA